MHSVYHSCHSLFQWMFTSTWCFFGWSLANDLEAILVISLDLPLNFGREIILSIFHDSESYGMDLDRSHIDRLEISWL